MRLIQLQDDVVVAEEVRHLCIEGDVITVSFRNLPSEEDFEYEYDSEEEAQAEMKQAVTRMMDFVEIPLPPRRNEN